jgi:imidazolonepropionase-like amidohydrolase
MGRHLISGGTVLDATGAAPQNATSVLVEDNRITKIGPDAAVTAAAEAGGAYQTIDATGRTVMPGMIDAHCHISYGNILSFEELDLYASVEYRTLRAANNAKKVLRAGITAFSDPGSTWNISVAIRDAINSGLIEGPRMASAGRYITTFNAIGSPWPTWMEHPKSSFAALCNTRDEMITEARREIKEGVDMIKVAGDGDVLTGSDELAGSISLEDLRAIADVTHRLGKVCTIHARSGRATADAIRAGFDWIIHGSYMSDDDFAVLVEHRTPVIPTFSLLVNTLDWGPDLGTSSFILDAYKEEIELLSKVITRAHAEGITIIAGTDSGQGSVPYGEWHARELEHLVTYGGMSTMDAIRAGTANAALTVGMQDEIGTLEEGKLADLLVVNGDPLADIAVLQDKSRLEVIMKDGAVVDTTTPIPEPSLYNWEKPKLYWSDSRMPTQEFVREHATNKPAWMMGGERRLDAAE